MATYCHSISYGYVSLASTDPFVAARAAPHQGRSHDSAKLLCAHFVCRQVLDRVEAGDLATGVHLLPNARLSFAKSALVSSGENSTGYQMAR